MVSKVLLKVVLYKEVKILKVFSKNGEIHKIVFENKTLTNNKIFIKVRNLVMRFRDKMGVKIVENFQNHLMIDKIVVGKIVNLN